MTLILTAYFLLQIPLKMFAYRARGMAHADLNDTESRFLFWALPFAIDGALFSYLLAISGLTIAAFILGCALSAFVAATVPHAKWQTTGFYNYFIMGLVTTGMLTIMMLPLLAADYTMLKYMPLGLLGWPACIIGYNSPFRMKTLRLFGVTWCVPGDSSWEEFFIGALPFGTVIACIGLRLL